MVGVGGCIACFVCFVAGFALAGSVLILVLFGVQEGIDDSWESDYAVSISDFNFGKRLCGTVGVLVEIGRLCCFCQCH